MCGILLSIGLPIGAEERGFIAARGPDSVQEFSFTLRSVTTVKGVSSVLHLRGSHTVTQPLQSPRFCFQWNGEVFEFAGVDAEALLEMNDTEFLFRQLSTLPLQVEDLSLPLAGLFQQIHGPWAFALVDKLHGRVYFGRDGFGRRSLLFSAREKGLKIASCAIEGGIEAEAGVIYCYDSASSSVITTTAHIKREWTVAPTFPITDASALINRAWREFESAVSKRILHLPPEKGIALLFSGGVDSMLMGVACGRVLKRYRRPIKLINVAFEHPGLMKQLSLSETTPAYWSAIPDRQSGLEAFHDLSRLFPEVSFQFVECNVSRAEYDGSRERVKQLMAPNDTVMDLSLAMVIWHGSQSARGASSAMAVLLCGMGADEQLGGYSRHRSLAADPSALRSELLLDLNRISTRNLGRDDRCISDAGLEGRFPFLDEAFVGFVGEEVSLQGKIDKWLLREMLRQGGVSEHVAGRPKKAMQFGAKSAKIESSQCLGTDRV